MTTFNKIIKNVINLENNIFSSKYDKIDDISYIHSFFFGMLTDENLCKIYKSKFDFYHQTINNFYYFNKNIEKMEFSELFFKIQIR